MALVKHWTFHTYVYDLGIFHQMLWNSARGHWFASSLKHMNYLGDHFSPSLILLAPLTWLPRSVELLLIVGGLVLFGIVSASFRVSVTIFAVAERSGRTFFGGLSSVTSTS